MSRTKYLKPPGAVRLADIAEHVGMSRSGVSRALRNDPEIPLATCRRVQAAARKLGFVADREVSRAFQLVRLSGQPRIAGTIGFIDAWPTGSWRQHPSTYITRIFASARDRAEEFGYRLEVFSLTERGMTSRRLQAILDARGVTGLLIPPLPPDVHELDIDWSAYACVATTHSLQRPELHRVSPHQFQTMSLALERLHKLGYRRIGFLTWNELDIRVNHHYRAAYLSYQYDIAPRDRLPMLMVAGEFADHFEQWFREQKPDAIIGCDPGLADLVSQRNGGDFGRIGFVSIGGNLHRPGHPLHRKVTHVEQNTHHVGRTGIDHLLAQIDRRERGVPRVANVVMIESAWVDGLTVRADPL